MLQTGVTSTPAFKDHLSGTRTTRSEALVCICFLEIRCSRSGCPDIVATHNTSAVSTFGRLATQVIYRNAYGVSLDDPEFKNKVHNFTELYFLNCKSGVSYVCINVVPGSGPSFVRYWMINIHVRISLSEISRSKSLKTEGTSLFH